jgi:hypothetical protein
LQLICNIILKLQGKMTVGERTHLETGLAALSRGEHLLVWTWRKIVTGGGGCPLIAREFSLSCGEDAGEVLATLYTFLQALACAGRRHLEVGYPGYAEVTIDERRMLLLIAAGQRGGASLLDAHLRTLAGAALRPALATAARALGTALDAHELQLPLPASSSGLLRSVPNTGIMNAMVPLGDQKGTR